jgi:CubicO group peptidase (beta-lactamase class C family)
MRRAREALRRRLFVQGAPAAATLAAGRHAMRTVSADASASAAPKGFRPGGLEAVDAVVEAGVGSRAFPGAVLAVGRHRSTGHLRAFGRFSYDADAAPVAADTLYDLASLTKVVVTTTLAMILVDEGRLDLDTRVHSFFPGFSGAVKERVTVRQLLSHSGGLQWWAPLYEELKGKPAYLRRIVAMDLTYEPGTRSVYSDLGIIVLGDILERMGGAPLDELARLRVLVPLGMKDAQYRPPGELLPRIAPTENDPWRGKVVRGEVHDENAFALGGVAPHAGLFATASDLARLAEMLLDGGSCEGKRIVSRAAVELFTARAGVPGSSRALGWDTPTDESGRRSSTRGEPGFSSAGSLLSARAFGHTGFTGTSMWMDPELRLYVILLTNRVHPTRENDAIGEVRAHVADAAVRALEGP